MRLRQSLRPWTAFLVLLLGTSAYLAWRPQLLVFESTELPLLFLGFVVFSISIGIWSQARLRRRMARLASIAEAIRDGDYSTHGDESGHDAIASVARSINDMASHIDRNLRRIKSSENQIREIAYRDPLTGLPNRRLFEEVLEREVEAARRYRYHLAIAVMDIDRLKDVNDSLGHAYGDLLLEGISQRLSEQVRGSDMLARLAGDEFALIMRCDEERGAVSSVLDRLRRRCREPFELEQREVLSSLSIGVCFFPEDGQTSQELMSNADFALYQAKRTGRNQVRQFDQSMNALAAERLQMERQLHRALDNEELLVAYQPIVSLTDYELVGLEVLVRWNHPHQGVVLPGKFVPLAEDTGLMPQLGYQVLMKACRHAVLWQDTGLRPLPISINVSVRQLQAGDFVDRLERVLLLTGLDPRYLKLEITENVAVEGTRILDHLSRLRDRGLGLVIDDFGTGYSSFNYLLKHRIDSLKIDRSFIQGISVNPDSKAIVRAILSLGKSLGLEVVAEGIETLDQLELLHREGCEIGQGFLFSPALTKLEIQELLAAGVVAPTHATARASGSSGSGEPRPEQF